MTVERQATTQTPDRPARNWLTVQELADQLDIHADTIREALSSGQLPGIRIGKQWRIPFTAMDQLVTTALEATLDQQHLLRQTNNKLLRLQDVLDRVRSQLQSFDPTTAPPRGDDEHSQTP